MKSEIFKAYDIRGRYAGEINEAVVFEITKAIRQRLKGEILVAHDARLSSPKLYRAILQALDKKIAGGMMTTPLFYFLVKKLKAGGGIMVTASHNPKEDNGLKIVGKDARPISGQEIQAWLK